MSRRSDEPVEQVEIEVEILRESEKAFLVNTDKASEVWIPKSQVSDHALDWSSMFIPRWLAKEKGLI